MDCVRKFTRQNRVAFDRPTNRDKWNASVIGRLQKFMCINLEFLFFQIFRTNIGLKPLLSKIVRLKQVFINSHSSAFLHHRDKTSLGTNHSVFNRSNYHGMW